METCRNGNGKGVIISWVICPIVMAMAKVPFTFAAVSVNGPYGGMNVTCVRANPWPRLPILDTKNKDFPLSLSSHCKRTVNPIERVTRCATLCDILQVINWKLENIGMNPTAEAYLVLHRFGSVSITHSSDQGVGSHANHGLQGMRVSIFMSSPFLFCSQKASLTFVSFLALISSLSELRKFHWYQFYNGEDIFDLGVPLLYVYYNFMLCAVFDISTLRWRGVIFFFFFFAILQLFLLKHVLMH